MLSTLPALPLAQHIFVSAVQTSGCGSSTLAYASGCQRDQQDRPIFATINYCPNFLPASAAVGTAAFDFLLSVSLHETFHGEGLLHACPVRWCWGREVGVDMEGGTWGGCEKHGRCRWCCCCGSLLLVLDLQCTIVLLAVIVARFSWMPSRRHEVGLA